MSEPTAVPAPEQIKDTYPQTENGGKVLLDVLPADWGVLRCWDMIVPTGVAVKVWEAVAAAIDPSDPETGLPVSRTIDVVEALLINYNTDIVLWYGDIRIAPGFGLPVRRATAYDGSPSGAPSDSPGIARLRLDLNKTYLYQESGADANFVLALVGRNVEPPVGSA